LSIRTLCSIEVLEKVEYDAMYMFESDVFTNAIKKVIEKESGILFFRMLKNLCGYDTTATCLCSEGNNIALKGNLTMYKYFKVTLYRKIRSYMPRLYTKRYFEKDRFR
jgi:hypothetical protein